MPPLSLRRPLSSLWLLFSNRRWLIGFFTGGGGWALYVAALATAGVATLLTNAVPIAAGIVLFHERLPGGALGAVRVLAFAAVVAGAAALAKPEREALPT